MRTLEDLGDVAGKRVVVRVDFNVPLSDGTITDDARIQAALPTLRELRDRGAKLVLLAHLGRPKGRDESLTLQPVAARLAELLGEPVTLAPDPESVRGEDVVMVENVRFFDGETSNDPDLAGRYAALGDAFVNDAFGAAHRAHASTEGLARLLPSVAGRLLEREVSTLRGLLEEPARPFVAGARGGEGARKNRGIGTFLAAAGNRVFERGE